jgi:predicted amidohydrolase YtcJ
MFGKRLILLVMLTLCFSCSKKEITQHASIIYTDGNVLTMNDNFPKAKAIAVKDGLIIDLSLNQEELINKYKGANTKLISFNEKTVIPGIIDAHSHITTVSVQAVSANLLPPPDGGATDIPSLQNILREFIKTSPTIKKYGLVIGFNYDDSQLKEKRHPNRHELDAVSTEIPIVIMHQSGHLGVYNTLALKKAGIDENSKDPAGGTIYREKDGKTPSGLMAENAHFIVVFKLIPKYTKKDMQEMLLKAQDIYLKNGITTIQDGRTDPTALDSLIYTANNKKFKVDVVAYADLEMNLENKILQGPLMSKNYKNRFRIGGIKLSLDGSPQGKTAWFTKPYLVPPHNEKPSYNGFPIFKDINKLQKLISHAQDKGWQVLAHANGDAAIDQLIKVVGNAKKLNPAKALNTVLIHGQFIREDQIKKIKDLNIFPSVYPMHTFYWGDWHRNSVAGEQRASFSSPTASLLKAGLKFSIHTDAPVIFPDSIRLLDSAVNRVTRSEYILGPKERIKPLTALKAMTIWPAIQYSEESSKGSIEIGKLADFAVLSKDPLSISHRDLIKIKVLQTIKEGQTVYKLK